MNRNDAKFLAEKARNSKSFRDALDSLLKDFGVRQDLADSRLREIEQDHRATKEELSRCIRTLRTLENELKENAEHTQNLYKEIEVLQEKNKTLEDEKKEKEEAELASRTREEEERREGNEGNKRAAIVTGDAQAAARSTSACFCYGLVHSGASPNTQVIIEEEEITTTTEKIPCSELERNDHVGNRDRKGHSGTVNEITVEQKHAQPNNHIQSQGSDGKITRSKPRESDAEYCEEEDSTTGHRNVTNNTNNFQLSSKKTTGNSNNSAKTRKTPCERGRKRNRQVSSDSEETYFWDYSYSETGGPYDEHIAVIDETTITNGDLIFESQTSKTESGTEVDTLTSEGDEKPEGPNLCSDIDSKSAGRIKTEVLIMNGIQKNKDNFNKEETRAQETENVSKMDKVLENLNKDNMRKNRRAQNDSVGSADEDDVIEGSKGDMEYSSLPNAITKTTSSSETAMSTEQEKEEKESPRGRTSPRSILRTDSNTERRGAETATGVTDATVRFSSEIQTLPVNVPSSTSSCSSLSSPAPSTPASSPPSSPSTSLTLSPSYPSSVHSSTLSSPEPAPSPTSVSDADFCKASEGSVSEETIQNLGSSLSVGKGKEGTVPVTSFSPSASSLSTPGLTSLPHPPVTSVSSPVPPPTTAPSTLNTLNEKPKMEKMEETKTKELWSNLIEDENETNATRTCIWKSERSDTVLLSDPLVGESNAMDARNKDSDPTKVTTAEHAEETRANNDRKPSEDVLDKGKSEGSIEDRLTELKHGVTNATTTIPGNVDSPPVVSNASSPTKLVQANEKLHSGGKHESENTKDCSVNVRIMEEQVSSETMKRSEVKVESVKVTQEKRTSKDNSDEVKEKKDNSEITQEKRQWSRSNPEPSHEQFSSREDEHQPQASVNTKAPPRMSDPGKGTEEKEVGMCANCSNIASQKCAMCHQVFYCKRECQKKHWKTHKEQCQPYKVEENSELGRFMVATRNIKAGEVILIEDPIVVGPKQITEPICVGCYKRVDGSYTCSKCSWPLCSAECEQSPDHKPECVVGVEIGSPIQITNFEDTNHFYEIVTPLRCLALKKKSPKKYEQLMALESHYEDRKGSHIFKENKIRVVGMLRNYFLLLEFDPDVIDCSEYNIHKIMGILDVNALEIRLAESEIQGLYPRFAMLEHSCIPNTKHKFGENKRVEVRAAVDIAKGEHLSTMYTHILWGTTARRDHLKHNKYFMCQCRRCSDPTELGTYFSALRCTRCPEAYMVSAAPLDLLASWICTSCNYTLTADEVTEINLKLGEEIERCLAQPSVEGLETLIAEKSKLVHSNHFHLFVCKHTLLQMYGRDKTNPENANFGEPMDAEVNRKKEQLCQEFLKMCMMLDPGMSRLAPYVGVTLYEYHLAMIAKARRALDLDPVNNKAQAKKELENARALLQQCMTVLKDEPEDQPEGVLFKVAQGNLEELSAWAVSLA